jgi:hypothetical protein
MTTDPSLIPVRRYLKPVIGAAAAVLMGQVEAGLLSQLDLAQAVLAFCFRDDADAYWFLDPCAGQWYHLTHGDWQPDNEVPDVLEGPDNLPATFDIVGGPEDPPPPPVMTPIDALATGVEATGRAYARGQINNQDAEVLLARHVLIDRRGQVWTVGVQSGRWYVFEPDRWTAASAPPDPRTLARLRPPAGPCPSCSQSVSEAGPCPHCGAMVPPELEGVDEEAYALIQGFLMRFAGILPERVTQAWMPPAGYPNVMLPIVERVVPLGTPERTSRTGAPTQPLAAPVVMRWFLLRDGTGERIELGASLRIGRADDNDLPIPSPGISRYHAVIERASTGYTIADLGSANGTSVNDQCIAGPTALHPGDVITLYDIRLTVVAEGSALQEGPPGARCPSCSEWTRSDVRFCPQCGSRRP